MKKFAALAFCSVAMSANAQYAASSNSSIHEYSESSTLPQSVKFVSGGNQIKRIECYSGKGCFTKSKNPENNLAHSPTHGRTASANPPPANATVWMNFTMRGTNVFSNGIIDHVPIFVRSNPTGTVEGNGLGLAIYNQRSKPWNPSVNCIDPNNFVPPKNYEQCWSGVRLETRAEVYAGSLGMLPNMNGSKTDGYTPGVFRRLAPAQYLLDDVDYIVDMHATTEVISVRITAPSLGSVFQYSSMRPFEYGSFQWTDTGYFLALMCQGDMSCQNYSYQNFSLEFSNIAMGWFIPS